ncbi:hypothetical protein BIU98_14345 [Curtobacterium sp. MMLR14_010]|nr:hypothetical protein BIU98_14345 [Curtobacterium sp. MMLR14_010]
MPPATRTAASATAVTGIQFLRVMLARSLLVGGASDWRPGSGARIGARGVGLQSGVVGTTADQVTVS